MKFEWVTIRRSLLFCPVFLIALFAGLMSMGLAEDWAIVVRFEKRFTKPELVSLLGKNVTFTSPNAQPAIGKIFKYCENGRENWVEVEFHKIGQAEKVRFTYKKAKFDEYLQVLD